MKTNHDPAKPAPFITWTLASLSLSMLMPSLETSTAHAALPILARAFHATFQEVQWIVLAYLLVITTLIVSVGRLGDLTGRRRLLLAGAGLFTFASLLCGLAPSLWFLVTARAVQGLGAAIMMALTLAFVGETVPKEKTGSAMGLLGTMSALGTTLGPSLGGMLITGFNWRAIFLINVPLGILNFVLLYRHLPTGQKKAKVDPFNFDFMGTLLLAATLTTYALAMTLGQGRFGFLTSGLLLRTLAAGGLFILNERRTPSPLIRLSIFRDPLLSAGLVMTMLVSTVIMATLVVGPFYLSRSLGLETAWVGLALSAGPFMAALTGVPAGRIVDRFGARRMTLMGLIGVAVGSFLLAIIPAGFGIRGYIPPIILVTGSYALFQAANNTQIMTGIGPDRRGAISGKLSLSRNLGLITGASLIGAVFAAASHASDITRADPEAVATGMRTTFAVATALMLVALVVTSVSHAISRRRALTSSSRGM